MKMVVGLLIGPLVLATASASDSDPFGNLVDPTKPFQPAVETHEPAPAQAAAPRPRRLVLQSVLISPVSRQAIINGRKVVVGDVLEGATIEAIRPHEVVIRRAEETETLRVLAGAAAGKEERHD